MLGVYKAHMTKWIFGASEVSFSFSHRWRTSVFYEKINAPNTLQKTYAPNWSRKHDRKTYATNRRRKKYILAWKLTFFIFSHFLVRKSLRVEVCQNAKNEEKIDFEKIFKKYARGIFYLSVGKPTFFAPPKSLYFWSWVTIYFLFPNELATRLFELGHYLVCFP